MGNINLKTDESIILEKKVRNGNIKGDILFTLTNQRMIFEKEKGIFKKKLRVIEEILLDDIKVYDDKVQIEQQKSNIIVQTNSKKVEFTCNNIFEAKKIVDKIINLKTGTNILERAKNGANKTVKIITGIAGVVGAAAAIPFAVKELIKNGKELVSVFKGMIKK